VEHWLSPATNSRVDAHLRDRFETFPKVVGFALLVSLFLSAGGCLRSLSHLFLIGSISSSASPSSTSPRTGPRRSAVSLSRAALCVCVSLSLSRSLSLALSLALIAAAVKVDIPLDLDLSGLRGTGRQPGEMPLAAAAAPAAPAAPRT
jgi:hypothetical protein